MLGPGRLQSAPAPKNPTVTYTFELKGTKPEWFQLSIDASGKATYSSRDSLESASEDVNPDVVRFTVRDATRESIFDLAKRANYFEGDFDFTKHRVANTGKKKLAYADENQAHETTFIWSENPAIQQLSKIFVSISTTQQFGSILAFKRRYDPLGLDADFRRMEELQKEGELGELQSIVPVLRAIADDPSVLKIARARARSLLAKVE